MRQLSLTARLTVYFSLCSAAVLLDLDMVTALAMDQYLAVRDYTALHENVNIIEKIVESNPAEQVPERIREAIRHRVDLVVRIQGSDGHTPYITQDFDFQTTTQALAQLRHTSETLVWVQSG